jgi:IS1 family transposase
LEYLKERYPVSGSCPVDNKHRLYLNKQSQYYCRYCKRNTSQWKGTIFEYGRIDFTTRLDILWQLAQKPVTNKQAQREWSLGPDTYQRYQYKIFKTCQDWMSEAYLVDKIEVDEAFLGKGTGRSALPALFIAVEKNKKGKVIVQKSDSFTKESCHAFINHLDNDQISTIHTDGWKGYAGIDKRSIHLSYKQLPQVHSAISQLKTYLKAYVRPVHEKHLPLYLAHWAWLYSYRRLSPEERFQLLLDQGMKGRILK